MPGPGIDDVDQDPAVSGRGADRDRPAVRRPAEGVREQVREHLEDAVTVGDDRRSVGILVEAEREPAAPRLFTEARMRLRDERSDIHLLGVNREPVGIELGEVEHVPDEPFQPDRLAGDDVEGGELCIAVVEEPVADGVDVALDRGQRRAQLVGDRHEELSFAVLGRGEACSHLVEPMREMADLVASLARRDANRVVAFRDLVGRGRQREHGPGDPARRTTTRGALPARAPTANAIVRRTTSGSH